MITTMMIMIMMLIMMMIMANESTHTQNSETNFAAPKRFLLVDDSVAVFRKHFP